MKTNGGQVFIFSVLSIVFVLLGVSTILVTTTLAGISLPKQQFREDVTQIALSGRGALASSLADVSNRLKNRAQISQYQNYTYLQYSESNTSDRSLAVDSLVFLSKWYNDTVKSYPVTGLNLTNSRPEFRCFWNDSIGCSEASMNIFIDMLNYGLEGFSDSALVELNCTIDEILATDGNVSTFTATFRREGGYPIDRMMKEQTSIYMENYDSINNHTSVVEARLESMRYLGQGVYLITYSTGLDTISNNLDSLWTKINVIPTINFTDGNITYSDSKTDLLNLVNAVKTEYGTGDYAHTRQMLWLQVRPLLDPNSGLAVVTNGTNTLDHLRLIDILANQLEPCARIVAMDYRGIIVSARGNLLDIGSGDSWPPMIVTAYAQPSSYDLGRPVDITLFAFADDRGFGSSNIAAIQYNISDTIPQAGCIVRPMSPTDGFFDSPYEEASATILNTSLKIGINYIWVRATDVWGNTGSFSRVKVTVIRNTVLHVNITSMTITWRKGPADINHYGVLSATVNVTDGTGTPIEGATVHGVWSGAISWQGDRVTGSDGTCIFDYPVEKGGHKTYTLTITSAYVQGYTWDGYQPSRSITS